MVGKASGMSSVMGFEVRMEAAGESAAVGVRVEKRVVIWVLGSR